MPELPEVETTRRGIEPLVCGRRVCALAVRQRQLRWPVPTRLRNVTGARIERVRRRAKYLLLDSNAGSVIVHLGMSGSLHVVASELAPGQHDHVDLALDDGNCLRLRDPRRFGAVLWTVTDPLHHPLLRGLGPEPFDPTFNGAYLHRLARGRRTAVKNLLMDSRVVAGVGNIYASESLHLAGIHPRRPAGRVSATRFESLCNAVRTVLDKAIDFGGTTLRDFTRADGKPGYFRHQLQVYGRAGELCPRCRAPLRQAVIGQRSSFFCGACQR